MNDGPYNTAYPHTTCECKHPKDKHSLYYPHNCCAKGCLCRMFWQTVKTRPGVKGGRIK